MTALEAKRDVPSYRWYDDALATERELLRRNKDNRVDRSLQDWYGYKPLKEERPEHGLSLAEQERFNTEQIGGLASRRQNIYEAARR